MSSRFSLGICAVAVALLLSAAGCQTATSSSKSSGWFPGFSSKPKSGRVEKDPDVPRTVEEFISAPRSTIR